ncbi:hypothetical protein [Desulfosporosinus lacus]|uniref:Uncharacterized protein n=1 Tax=Desulfosporosinus lacus DSM 15449 TaxID=1121420 RepID=A0A1M5WHL7_9FIRM|nr:hypothetical protein [Desulfosporosinus lacus]SHH86733.1 hypothetical protein SAMN02746098_01613 [Desulfosporosinus lacus DSM 15449]
MLTKAIEGYRTRVVMALQTTANAADDYVLPTGGAKSQILRCIVTMGDATDLVLTPKTADDAAGTNAAAVAADLPIYVNGVRQTDAKAYTVADATGNFIVDFVVDPAIIPTGKYIGMSYGNSNAANLMCATIVEDVAYKPTVA